jgi:hypothetical protein
MVLRAQGLTLATAIVALRLRVGHVDDPIGDAFDAPATTLAPPAPSAAIAPLADHVTTTEEDAAAASAPARTGAVEEEALSQQEEEARARPRQRACLPPRPPPSAVAHHLTQYGS